jgi:predicted aldo/keto reductase-like oxidoreductase
MTAHRQIHLDFHTSAGVTVGDKFHAAEFFDTLEAAKINSIAVFAKCHHGFSYFDTKVGTRHLGQSFDLIGQAAAEGTKRKTAVRCKFSSGITDPIENHAESLSTAQLREDSRRN